MDREVEGMRAAAAVLPVPTVLDRRPDAVLLELLPGIPAGSSSADPELVGANCAAVHRVLQDVPFGEGSLLHLDLHPFNVLVEGTDVSAVLDWANCAGGDPAHDRARTWSILTLDPAAVEFRRDPRAEALCAAWVDGLDPLDDAARAWACRRMLVDLADRHPPQALDPVRAELARLG